MIILRNKKLFSEKEIVSDKVNRIAGTIIGATGGALAGGVASKSIPGALIGATVGGVATNRILHHRAKKKREYEKYLKNDRLPYKKLGI